LITEQDNTTNTIIEKTEFLQARFYLTIKADFTDIEDFSFLKESFLSDFWEVDQRATEKEIETILKSRKLFKTLEINSISNSFIQAIELRIAETIARLATVC
jgi:hypothetical protein